MQEQEQEKRSARQKQAQMMCADSVRSAAWLAVPVSDSSERGGSEDYAIVARHHAKRRSEVR